MPPVPTVDYYDELEVEPSASLQEITASYRRLIGIHHPYQNCGHEEEAMARFQRVQRIQLAYEILSDPAQRALYNTFGQMFSSPSFDYADEEEILDYEDEIWDDEDDIWDDVDGLRDDDDDWGSFFFPFMFGFGFPFGGGFGSPMDWFFNLGYPRSRAEEFEAEMERLWQYEQQLRAGKDQAERLKRGEAEEARRKAKQAAKQEEEHTKQIQKTQQFEEEQEKQEQRWRKLNAVTSDERFAACLHSNFCEKIQQQKKFKCLACSAKRGMTAFECPYCSALLCQLCVGIFSDRRKKLDKSGGTEIPVITQETQDHDEDLDPAINGKAANGTEDTSADPTSMKDKTSKKKKKKSKKKSNPGPGKAEATGTPPTPPHKPTLEGHNVTENRNTRPAAVELQDASTDSITPQQREKATVAGYAPPDKATGPDIVADCTASSSKNGKAEAKSQKPAAPAKSHDHKKPAAKPAAAPTPGATHGYIRSTKPIKGVPEALLRRVMEKFGTVIWLKVTNKHTGNAHIEFADHDSLCKAMAASPVVINDHVSVDVVQSMECSRCGKFGHVARWCRIA